MLRPYLEGSRFVLRTDHDALKWILGLTEAKGKLARWQLRLQELEFDIVHRPGVQHKAADAMSRLPTDGGDNEPIDDEIPILSVTDETELVDDAAIKTLCDDEADSSRPDKKGAATTNDEPISYETFVAHQRSDDECKSFAATIGLEDSPFRYEDGVLVRVARIDGSLQRVVPKALRQRVLYLAHDPMSQGHPGVTKMYDTLRKDFYWPLLFNDVEDYVSNCVSCAKTRGTVRKHQSTLKLFPSHYPLQDVAMDLVGPFKKTRSGKKFILVITDRYSNLTRSVSMAKTKAPDIAAAFLNNWVFPYGVPNTVLTDNGPQFIAEFFEFVCASIGVKRIGITAYHAQSNG